MSRSRWLLAGAVAGLLGAATVSAADRVVLCEEFTATWCQPCVAIGNALRQLQDANPNDVAVVQYHGSDAFENAFTLSRRDQFYFVDAYPTWVWDGVRRRVGSNLVGTIPTDYATRNATATDVTVQQHAEQLNSNTWRVTAIFGVEEAGTAKTVHLNTLRTLNHYPGQEFGTHYSNCCMANALEQTVTIQPGETHEFVNTFVIDSVSMARQTDISFISFAQADRVGSQALVYNANIMHWPFNAPPPATPGDADRDGDVDLTDLATLLSRFGLTAGANWSMGDFTGDSRINLDDLAVLLANFGL